MEIMYLNHMIIKTSTYKGNTFDGMDVEISDGKENETVKEPKSNKLSGGAIAGIVKL